MEPSTLTATGSGMNSTTAQRHQAVTSGPIRLALAVDLGCYDGLRIIGQRVPVSEAVQGDGNPPDVEGRAVLRPTPGAVGERDHKVTLTGSRAASIGRGRSSNVRLEERQFSRASGRPASSIRQRAPISAVGQRSVVVIPGAPVHHRRVSLPCQLADQDGSHHSGPADDGNLPTQAYGADADCDVVRAGGPLAVPRDGPPLGVAHPAERCQRRRSSASIKVGSFPARFAPLVT